LPLLQRDTYVETASRAPTVGALSDAGAIADAYMEVGGRAMQEQLPRSLGLGFNIQIIEVGITS